MTVKAHSRVDSISVTVRNAFDKIKGHTVKSIRVVVDQQLILQEPDAEPAIEFNSLLKQLELIPQDQKVVSIYTQCNELRKAGINTSYSNVEGLTLNALHSRRVNKMPVVIDSDTVLNPKSVYLPRWARQLIDEAPVPPHNWDELIEDVLADCFISLDTDIEHLVSWLNGYDSEMLDGSTDAYDALRAAMWIAGCSLARGESISFN